MKKLALLTSCLALALLPGGPALAQTSGIPVEPPKPLPAPLSAEQQRQALEKELNNLVVRQGVIKGVREKVSQVGVTTAAQGNKVVVLDILMTEAMVEPLHKVTESMEDYRFSIIRDKTRKQRLLQVRQQDIERLTGEINRQAETLVTGKTAAGADLTATERINLQRLVTQHSRHRQSLQLKCEQYQHSVTFFERELDSLKTLDEQLEGLTSLAAAHLEFHQDLLEDNQEQLASEELMNQQESLKRAVDLFLSIEQPGFIPPASENTPEKRPNLAAQPETLEPALTAEEQSILDQELEAARQRLGLKNK